jgi:mono/diheme cytochrome c family protein
MSAKSRALAGALTFAVAICLTGTVYAADTDGQALFRENCKSCHDEGSPNGEYTPMTLIQDQWTRFFDRKFERTHKDVADPARGNQPVTEAISPEELEAIKKFAIDHAADSENPMTCG